MKRQQFFAKVISIAFATSLLISGCMAAPAASNYAPSAPAESAAEAAPAAESSYSPSYERPAPAGMNFEDYGVRGFVASANDNLSTFGVDVDTGAYTLARSYVQDGFLPPEDAVRSEEFVNYFNYHYPNPKRGETFTIHVDGAPSPVLADASHRMMRVGIQGYAVPADERPNANLTFVIDVSGSMDMENRLGLAKRALYLLVDELCPTDQVAIVVYGDTAHRILPMTSAEEKQTILRAINQLAPEGSTNAAAGLELGYEIAAKNFDPEAINRVILVSDGVANVGPTESDQILRLIKRQAEEGITMTTIGMGMGNYNDVLMEQLADDGDGFYSYVDTLEQARRVFVDQLTSTLLTIAKDAKIQVEFNPETVEQYRLVGYENRKVKDDDFRDDDVDAGEVGAGHSVTALYELEMVEDASDPDATIATVHLRWQEPASGEAIEIAKDFSLGEMAQSFEQADPRFQLATIVAEYAEVLRHSEYGEETWLGDLFDEVERINAEIEAEEGESDADVDELAQLLQLADSMMPMNPASLED